LIEKWLECLFHFSEIDHPSRGTIDGTGNMELHAKGMTVEAPAFVPFRDVWEAVGRLEPKFLV
jgi:hypothetical protein